MLLRPGHETMPFRDVRAPARSRRGDLDGPARRRRGRACATSAPTRRSSPASSTTSWPRSLAGAEEIHFPFGREPALDAAVARLLGRLRVAERRGDRAPVRLCRRARDAARDAPHQVARRRSRSSAAPPRSPREAHIARHAAPRAPRRSEHEIEALIDYTFRKSGGTGPGYPTIVGGGANATILHYVENRAPLVRGQLLLIDAGLRDRRLHRRRDAHVADRRAVLTGAAAALRGGAGDAARGDRGGQAGRDARRDPQAGGRAADRATWWRWAC